MLSLILALVVAEPAATTAPAAAPAPQPAPKVAKADAVVCKWMVGKGGIARQVCATKKQWRDEQITRQQHVDEFQRRQLTITPR
jgi:hypothetical protein